MTTPDDEVPAERRYLLDVARGDLVTNVGFVVVRAANAALVIDGSSTRTLADYPHLAAWQPYDEPEMTPERLVRWYGRQLGWSATDIGRVIFALRTEITRYADALRRVPVRGTPLPAAPGDQNGDG